MHLEDLKSCGAIHARLRTIKPKPEFCQRCRERPATDLSYQNKTGYSKNPNDYEWLCGSCHELKDKGNGVIITKAKIHRIREFYTYKAATQGELANLFKVSIMTISNIINYKIPYQKLVALNIYKELVRSPSE